MKNKRPFPPLVNDSSLSKESWKIMQVIAEFVEGYERLLPLQPLVSVFGSSQAPQSHRYCKLGEAIGQKLSHAGFSVLTGGGPGIMRAVNKGAYKDRSFSVGLSILLSEREPANEYQDLCLRFRHFFTRKVMFVKYAAAYVVMPGGLGTLDELVEILALIQTHKAKRIPVILVVKKFWQDLLNWLKNFPLQEKFISARDLQMFTIVDTAEQVVAEILKFYNNKIPCLQNINF